MDRPHQLALLSGATLFALGVAGTSGAQAAEIYNYDKTGYPNNDIPEAQCARDVMGGKTLGGTMANRQEATINCMESIGGTLPVHFIVAFDLENPTTSIVHMQVKLPRKQIETITFDSATSQEIIRGQGYAIDVDNAIYTIDHFDRSIDADSAHPQPHLAPFSANFHTVGTAVVGGERVEVARSLHGSTFNINGSASGGCARLTNHDAYTVLDILDEAKAAYNLPDGWENGGIPIYFIEKDKLQENTAAQNRNAAHNTNEAASMLLAGMSLVNEGNS